MSDQQFNTIAHFFAETIKSHTPRDTGNLAFKATRIQPLGSDAFRIYVSTKGDHLPQSQDGIAPYFVFVNDRPMLTFKNGTQKKNRNYQYFQKAMNLGINNLLGELNAYLKEGE